MTRFAFDSSARMIDADGRLHVERTHISKAAVNPYYGHEIPGYEQLGLQADKVYYLLRDPVELERGADTFKRNYILSKHVPLTVTNIADDPELKKLIVGSIGSDVYFSGPYLDADLCIWDASAIAGIESGQVRELSCAYRYDPVMEPGEFNGTKYDGRMTNIRGNHLALVEVGRAGSDVYVADQNPFKKESPAMKMSKLGKALIAALGMASPKLAQDSALPALVGDADRKSFKKEEVKAKLLALDSELDPQQLDNVIDALLGVEQEPMPVETPAAAADESPAEKIRALLAGKVDQAIIDQIAAMCATPAADEGAGYMKPDEVKAAMDSLRKDLQDAAQAARDVRSVVGDVAMDSAGEIYAFALDQMKVDRKDVEGVAALRALFRVASSAASAVSAVASPEIAQDAAAANQMFPGASRFTRS